MSTEKSTNKKKVLTSSLAVGLAALMLVGGGTFAYLRSTTDEKVNEFQTNKVEATLTESENNYSIIPGTTQTKDPTVFVDNTVDAYVYVEVTDKTEGLVGYEIADGWTALDNIDNVYYQEVAAGGTVTEGLAVLKGNTVTYDKTITNEDMQNKDKVTLSFKAIAMQKAPFNDPVNAYLQVDKVIISDGNANGDSIEKQIEDSTEENIGIILTDDVVFDSTANGLGDQILEIPSGKTVVLNLNGKTITTKGYQDRPIINRGTMTVTGNGTIDTTAANGYGAIRNFGTLTVENGTFLGNGLGGGSAVDTQSGGVTTINGGTYYATAAIMNRAGGKTTINDGDFEGVTNANELYSSGGIYSYAIRNDGGEMTINGGYVHGSMNGGVASSYGGTVTINGGYFKVEKPEKNQSYYVLVTDTSTNSKIIVNDGTFEQTNGTDHLIGGFSGMPSWDATGDLEANGYTINGGTFILNGETVAIG